MSGKRSARGGAKQAELLAAQQAPEGLDDAELALSSDEEYESGEEEGSELGLSGSGSDADDSEEEDEGRPRSSGVDREIENAALAYMAAVQKRQQRQQAGGSGRCERGGCRRRWGPRVHMSGLAACCPPPSQLQFHILCTAPACCSDSEEDEDEEDSDAGEEPAAAARGGGGEQPAGSNDSRGGEESEDEERPQHDDPASDSSEDERAPRNTIGQVPLEWYKDEEHIG